MRLMLHGNYYLMIGIFPDICYLIKLLTNKSAFWEYLEKDSNKSLLPKLFGNETILLAKRVVLAKYISNL